MQKGAIQMSACMAPQHLTKLEQSWHHATPVIFIVMIPCADTEHVHDSLSHVYAHVQALACAQSHAYGPPICLHDVQVLQLQSATKTSSSQPVDYQAGIEAMVLAILQQTNYSQQNGLADLGPMSVLTSQDKAVQDALVLTAYSSYLNNALNVDANLTATVETSLLNMTFSSSVLPVRHFKCLLNVIVADVWQMHGICGVSAAAIAWVYTWKLTKLTRVLPGWMYTEACQLLASVLKGLMQMHYPALCCIASGAFAA